ncbi:MAG: D-alanyl-D-alanine carboxypeptidase [Proteobacteria bacterium]|nr:D-alanyl-D-alanine carboxypeptidase [Pseudomonadota bacterium]
MIQKTVLLILLLLPSLAWADLEADVSALAKGGIVYVADAEGQSVLNIAGERSFIPASTLKVFTCVLADEHLGMDSRFETRFFLEGDRLIVRGGGDPFLVSEELDAVVAALAEPLGDRALSGVFIDDSWFEAGIVVPGVGGSEEPYDALNSATAVNFNTINVRVDGSTVTSAEEQTPLTPLAREVALRRGVKGKLRVNLSNDPGEVRRYAAELIAEKLRGAGRTVGAEVGDATATGEPIYVHRNSRTLGEVCAGLLYYSNNYIANQVFLAIGAHVHGAPASLEKSVRVATAFIDSNPDLAGLVVTEGSGISYENQATASAMIGALALFEPHKGLLRQKGGTPNKTGTLKVTKTVVGYLDTKTHGTVRFVISLDGSGSNRRWQIIDLLRDRL